MKAHSLHLLWLCAAITPEAYAQVLGLSIPPALESIGSALQSLVDPTPTHIATVPSPRIVTTRATPAPIETTPSPIASPPPPPTTSSAQPTTFITFSTPSTSRSTPRTSHHIPLIRTTSTTTSHATTKLAEAAASTSASPTSTATPEGSNGAPSKGAIAGIVIGVFAALGLIGAALYALYRNGRGSEAWANWQESRRNKHKRLSDTSFLNPTSAAAVVREKEPTLPQVADSGYGNGTMLGRSPPAAAAALSREGSINSNYGQGGEALRVVNSEVPDAESNLRGGEADAYYVDHSRGLAPTASYAYPSQSAPDLSPIVERDSPGPPPPQPAVYHQARQIDVRIKRKAVPQGEPRGEALMQGQRLPYRPYPRQGPPRGPPGQPRMHPAIGGPNWPRQPANAAYWVEDSM